MKKFLTIQKAFTLAETLVVVGIIGIIATLTLPNVNKSTGDKEKVVKLKKTYSNLEQAFGMAKIKYGTGYTNWFKNSSSKNPVAERIFEYMKISKTCGYNNNAGCFAKNSNLDGSDFVAYKVITTDGTSIYIDCFVACYAYVDIDGPNKGESTVGKDIFCFGIDDNKGIVPYGGGYQNYTDADCIKKKDISCTSWVINYGNLDYLKTGTDGKCPDKKTILDGNKITSCK